VEVSNISIIGSGNLAWAYAHAFYDAGIQINNIISRNISEAEKIANQVRAEAFTDYKWVEKSEMIIICVSDDAIKSVADSLEPFINKQIVVHSSGASSKGLLGDFELHGVLWPLQTITKGNKVNWKETPLYYDANDPEAASGLRYLSSRISDKTEMRNDAERQLMHLAAVWANNFVNHMLVEATEVLDIANIPYEVLIPILKQTIEKVEITAPISSQTGPALRGDKQTMENHINILKKVNHTKSDLYQLVSQRISSFKR